MTLTDDLGRWPFAWPIRSSKAVEISANIIRREESAFNSCLRAEVDVTSATSGSISECLILFVTLKWMNYVALIALPLATRSYIKIYSLFSINSSQHAALYARRASHKSVTIEFPFSWAHIVPGKSCPNLNKAKMWEEKCEKKWTTLSGNAAGATGAWVKRMLISMGTEYEI